MAEEAVINWHERRARYQRDRDEVEPDRRHRKATNQDDSQKRTTDDAHREYPLTSYTSVP